METEKPILFPKITASKAADVCSKFHLSDPAKALLKPEYTPAEYLRILEQHQFSTDAVNLLAYGMPEVESVWWACLCTRSVLVKLNSSDKSALLTAETWAKNPNSGAAASANDAAMNTNMRGPGGWTAQAAGWSSTNRAASAPSGEKSTSTGSLPKAVSGAVLLAAGARGQPTMPELPKVNLAMPEIKMPQFNALGIPKIQMPNIDQGALAAMLLAFPNLSAQLNPMQRMAFFASLALIQSPLPALKAALAQIGLPALGGWTGQGVPWLQAMFPNASIPSVPALPNLPAIPSVPALPKLGSLSLPGIGGPNLAIPSVPGVPQLPNFPNLNVPGFASIWQGMAALIPAAALPSILAALSGIKIPPVDLGKLFAALQPFIEIGKQVASGKATPAGAV